MTKSKTPHEQFDEGFWNDDAAPVIREEPRKVVFTIWKSGQRGSAKQ